MSVKIILYESFSAHIRKFRYLCIVNAKPFFQRCGRRTAHFHAARFFILIILAALAAAAYWYYKQNAETVNRQFEQIQKEAQQQLQQGKHAIEEHTVNRKSNYKKQIESIAND